MLLLGSARAVETSKQFAAQFQNRTKAAGIGFVHVKGQAGAPMILAEMGPGVCVADFDGDGWPDFYIVNGGNTHQHEADTRNALFHNNGDGSFTDVTATAGVPGSAYGLGCVWGDYDNDGRPDLYVTQYGTDILYHNDGNGHFTDVTQKAGVGALEAGTLFHSGAVFFDYDRDGRLDLYVGGYVSFRPDSPQSCIVFGIRTSCAPSAYNGSANALFHNNGDGTFTNVTKTAGLFDDNGKNLAVGVVDYDGDGWPDLFVANDGQRADLFRNQGDGTFHENGMLAGMAVTGQGRIMAGMCISLGDFNGDGQPDLYISDWQGSGGHLWANDGKGFFDEVSVPAGLTRATQDRLSFGGGFVDFDNDGFLDLFIANGHVFPSIDTVSPGVTYRQRNTLLHNNGNGTFADVSAAQDAAWQRPALGRGAAFADFDNDGAVDILVGNDDDAPALLHNRGSANHFVSLKLTGTRSNRDGIGAKVRLTTGGTTQVEEVQSGGSYLSQSDLRAHFGLGATAVAGILEVRWPSGLTQRFQNIAADRFYELQEGDPALRPQTLRGRER